MCWLFILDQAQLSGKQGDYGGDSQVSADSKQIFSSSSVPLLSSAEWTGVEEIWPNVLRSLADIKIQLSPRSQVRANWLVSHTATTSAELTES